MPILIKIYQNNLSEFLSSMIITSKKKRNIRDYYENNSRWTMISKKHKYTISVFRQNRRLHKNRCVDLVHVSSDELGLLSRLGSKSESGGAKIGNVRRAVHCYVTFIFWMKKSKEYDEKNSLKIVWGWVVQNWTFLSIA